MDNKNKYRALVENRVTSKARMTRWYPTWAEAQKAGENLAKRDVRANCWIAVVDKNGDPA